MKGVKQFVDDQIYYLIEFPVADFLRFLGGNPKSTYQRREVLDFLTSLPRFPPLVNKFSEIEFRSSIIFPLVKVRKQSRSWIVRIAQKSIDINFLSQSVDGIQELDSKQRTIFLRFLSIGKSLKMEKTMKF